MKRYFAAGALAVSALVATSVLAGEALKSGPPAGAGITTPFHPININGASAGKKNCLV